MKNMREIKFRAWDGEKMIQVNDVVLSGAKPKGYWKENSVIESSEILMQFTGLHDKNGKEIYEGDIVKVHEEDEWDDESAIKDFVVEWGNEYPAFTLKDYPDLEYNSLQHAANVVSCEVVGNIYENPELITTPTGE